jgi:hypothetical protein
MSQSVAKKDQKLLQKPPAPADYAAVNSKIEAVDFETAKQAAKCAARKTFVWIAPATIVSKLLQKGSKVLAKRHGAVDEKVL